MLDGEDFRPVPRRRQPGAGLLHLRGVHVRGVEVALALELLQHPAGVAAVAQGGVVAHLSGTDLKDLQDLIHQDGDVHTGGSLSALDDLLHIGPVLLRVVLLVLLLKGPGMGAFVPGAAPVLLLHGIISFS